MSSELNKLYIQKRLVQQKLDILDKLGAGKRERLIKIRLVCQRKALEEAIQDRLN